MSRDEKTARIWQRFRRGLLEQIPAEATSTRLALAEAYLEMGLLDDAEAEFAVVLEVHPENPSARAGLELVRIQRSPGQRRRMGAA
jgi:hypothetical protein